jgi:hypothetical protein
LARAEVEKFQICLVRFSWWPNGNIANRPLDIPEPDLLTLFAEAIRQGVFTDRFLKDLTKLLVNKIAE